MKNNARLFCRCVFKSVKEKIPFDRFLQIENNLNNGGDVTFQTDFRAVYARILENWLGTPSVPILGGDFRAGAPAIL